MKKVLLTILMAFIGLGVNAQTQNAPKKELENCKFDATGSTYSLTGVDVVPNTNAGELYNRAFKWVSTTYKNPNYVIKSKDKDAGVLVIYGAFDNIYKGRLELNFKDNKYKWVISEMVQTIGSDEPVEKNPMFKLMEGSVMKMACYNYITALRTAMLQKGDEW